MPPQPAPPESADFLVIGSGIAGLRATIALAPAGQVLILTKGEPTESNTGYAQGGIAAAIGSDDSPALHRSDTLKAGDGLCDEAAVSVLVEAGPRAMDELIAWGTRFDRDADGRIALGREAAHSVRRVLHAGDSTGREIERTLWAHVSGLSAVTTVNNALVTSLIVERGAVTGVRYFDTSGVSRAVRARATLLATGGAGQVFRETTNPQVATGDGIALAYDAGVRIADVEFVQFHPTALKLPGAPRLLMSEALRGEGARLINAQGEQFMARYHPGGDLAPRDVVARSILQEEQRTSGGVFLTLEHLDAAYVRGRFPELDKACRGFGLDLARGRVPVGPAAHYIMGGVDTDEWGRTSLPGLFAAGEVACTGVHGANRLASNSLLEGLVFGGRAGTAMQGPSSVAPLKANRRLARDGGPGSAGSAAGNPTAAPIAMDAAGVRDLMWRMAGVYRTRAGLQEAEDALGAAEADARRNLDASPADIEAWRALHLTTVAHLVARAALRREESRGGHFRVDFPKRDDEHWRFHLCDVRQAT